METDEILDELEKLEDEIKAALESARKLEARVDEAKSKLSISLLFAGARIYRGVFGVKCIEINEKNARIRLFCKEAIDLADFIYKHLGSIKAKK
ncbi:MAG: hypothetical protein LBO72_07290 [Helicobacteraceae bacterium]|jgi:hypothetical protein|nr:hypothetical protein [Helicobacteraceae bacterium]